MAVSFVPKIRQENISSYVINCKLLISLANDTADRKHLGFKMHLS